MKSLWIVDKQLYKYGKILFETCKILMDLKQQGMILHNWFNCVVLSCGAFEFS